MQVLRREIFQSYEKTIDKKKRKETFAGVQRVLSFFN